MVTNDFYQHNQNIEKAVSIQTVCLQPFYHSNSLSIALL